MRWIRHGASLAIALTLLLLPAPVIRADVDLSINAETLTDLLATMLPAKVELSLLAGHTITLEIGEFEIVGFEPTSEESPGRILGKLNIHVPALSLDLPVAPRLSLEVGEQNGMTVCNLLFDEVTVGMPMGEFDIAPFFPAIPVPADTTNLIESQRGVYQVRTRLAEATMGARALRLRFALDVGPAQRQAP